MQHKEKRKKPVHRGKDRLVYDLMENTALVRAYWRKMIFVFQIVVWILGQ